MTLVDAKSATQAHDTSNALCVMTGVFVCIALILLIVACSCCRTSKGFAVASQTILKVVNSVANIITMSILFHAINDSYHIT